MAARRFAIPGPAGLTVSLTIKRASDNQFWTGSAWQAGSATVAMTWDSDLSLYVSDTAPDARCFYIAQSSTGILLAHNEYDPITALGAEGAADWAPSLANVKIWLNLDSSNTDRDSLITLCRNSAKSAVEEYLQRSISSAERTYFLDGSGTTVLRLPDYPVTAISSVHIDTSFPRDWATADLINSDYYQVGGDNSNNETQDHILRIDGNVWTAGEKNVRAIATTGYSAVPDGLHFATLEYIAWIFMTAENKNLGITSRGESGGSVGYDMENSGIPKSIRFKLDPYRRMTF